MRHSLKGADGGDSYAGSGKGRNGDRAHSAGGNQATNKGTIAGHLRDTQGRMGLATSASRIWGVPLGRRVSVPSPLKPPTSFTWSRNVNAATKSSGSGCWRWRQQSWRQRTVDLNGTSDLERSPSSSDPQNETYPSCR